MWRETNLYGILFSPLIVYGVLALGATLLLRPVLLRTGLYRWIWNPALAEVAVFMCVLGLLVRFF